MVWISGGVCQAEGKLVVMGFDSGWGWRRGSGVGLGVDRAWYAVFPTAISGS